MKYIFVIITLCIQYNICGQNELQFSTTSHDYGLIDESHNRYFDIQVKNTSNKKIYFLNHKADKQFNIAVSKRDILPDSSITIRIKYNPEKRGKFNYTIPLYFSNSFEVFPVEVSGKVIGINKELSQDCPDFNQKKKFIKKEIDVIVKDEESKKPISKAKVTFIRFGTELLSLYTNNKGKETTVLPINLYYIVTTAENHYTNEKEVYINQKTKEIEIFLKKHETETPVPVEIPTNEEVDTTTKSIITKKIDSSFFSSDLYKANNIIFLLDVSSSMKSKGKLELMKVAMLQLVDIIRPEDKITLVSYASNANVIMPTQTGVEKQMIINKIQTIEAKGSTAGEEGMKLAYKLANENFIKGGNNQVIMITDGAFNEGTGKVDRLARKKAKQCIKISIVGIKSTKLYKEAMQRVATEGTGNYIAIDTYEEAQENIVEEILKQSRK